MPQLPSGVESALGPPLWRIFWIDESLSVCFLDTEDSSFSVHLPSGRHVPLQAYPYWPKRGIYPGDYPPAGTVYPALAAQWNTDLQWLGGVAAEFYIAMARSTVDSSRSPERFDWNRFIAYMQTDVLLASPPLDPWLVDWDAVAEKTMASGFDRRRIKAMDLEASILSLPAGCEGEYFYASPFQETIYIAPEQSLPLYSNSYTPAILFNASYVLRVRKGIAFCVHTP